MADEVMGGNVVEDAIGRRYVLKPGAKLRHWNTHENVEVVKVHADGTFDVRFTDYDAPISADWLVSEFIAQDPTPPALLAELENPNG